MDLRIDTITNAWIHIFLFIDETAIASQQLQICPGYSSDESFNSGLILLCINRVYLIFQPIRCEMCVDGGSCQQTVYELFRTSQRGVLTAVRSLLFGESLNESAATSCVRNVVHTHVKLYQRVIAQQQTRKNNIILLILLPRVSIGKICSDHTLMVAQFDTLETDHLLACSMLYNFCYTTYCCYLETLA